jgi:hypothetical protein
VNSRRRLGQYLPAIDTKQSAPRRLGILPGIDG